MLLLDVDGVLTDGRIVIDDQGVEIKSFHVRDGQGISLLMRAGIEVGMITARFSPAVRHRAKELGITLLRQRVRDKLSAYEAIKASRGLADHQIAYVGDDVLDVAILRSAGLAVTVADGALEARASAHWVTTASGGAGAVREVAEMLLKSQKKWRPLITKLVEKKTKNSI